MIWAAVDSGSNANEYFRQTIDHARESGVRLRHPF